ncbi:MAG: HAMP domain-containing histidine kinase [Chloroflexi bacterium]|nr:HAMP domain-containing histidine kinase [Chloroflexota bacterium]
MKDERKTKRQLINELVELRQRVAQLEVSETGQKQEEELLRIFQSNLPVGVFIIQDGTFRFVNDVFRRATGTSEDQLLRSRSMPIIHPEDRDRVRESAIEMLKGERSSPYQYRILAADGQIRWILEGVVSIQYRGKRAVLGHNIDITEGKQAEAKLQELYQQEKTLRQELETEAQRRIDFTRALVHELKTPLTPVLASSELLVSELREEPWLSIAKNIFSGASNLNKRVDELLDLARVEIGMLQVQPTLLDVQPLLQGIAGDMAAVVSSNEQSLSLALAPSLPLVWADEERLRQVVLNLLINATKFTPTGGSVILKAKVKNDTLVVEVEDTGPGIPEEEQQRLFQAYHRRLNDREHLGGLGLGLALSRHLVELHGGKIWVESEVGKGATFGFSIPLATASQKAAGLKEEAAVESSAY